MTDSIAPCLPSWCGAFQSLTQFTHPQDGAQVMPMVNQIAPWTGGAGFGVRLKCLQMRTRLSSILCFPLSTAAAQVVTGFNLDVEE